MATAPKNIPQDMPPKGGYGPINIDRIPLRRIMGAPLLGALLTVGTLGGFYLYTLNYKEYRRNELEMLGARFALMPMLIAQRDREVLKNMRKMREHERELMKDVEGWEVGTYYGEPIFQSDDPNSFRELNFFEYFNLSPTDYTAPRMYNRLWT